MDAEEEEKAREQGNARKRGRENVLYRTLHSLLVEILEGTIVFIQRGLLKFCVLQYIEFLLEILFFVFAYLSNKPAIRRGGARSLP